MFSRLAIFALAATASFSTVLAVSQNACDAPIAIPDKFDQNVVTFDVAAVPGGFDLEKVIEIEETGDLTFYFTVTALSACYLDLAINTCQIRLNGAVEETEITFYHGSSCVNGLITGGEIASVEIGCTDTGDQIESIGIPVDSPVTMLIEVKLFGVLPTTENRLIVKGTVSGDSFCGGDPHFNRWNNQVRDTFHGECDLVFLHNEEIDGKELNVHTRTTIEDSFSYVDAVAMKYGDDAIEFQHNAIYLNGAKVEDESEVSFGNGNKIVKIDDQKRKFVVNIKNKVAINVASMKKFMSVNIKGSPNALTGSTGILGDYETGDMIGRHGQEFDNFEDFAFEWQVNPEDPQIFMDARHPQLPYERCRMPSMSAEARRRKLRGADRKLLEAATEACVKNHIPANVQSCIDDVMFTGELELAEAF